MKAVAKQAKKAKDTKVVKSVKKAIKKNSNKKFKKAQKAKKSLKKAMHKKVVVHKPTKVIKSKTILIKKKLGKAASGMKTGANVIIHHITIVEHHIITTMTQENQRLAKVHAIIKETASDLKKAQAKKDVKKVAKLTKKLI